MTHRVPGRTLAALLGLGMLAASPALAQTAGKSPQTELINSLIAKSWADNELKPSRRANDNEYVRRVFLDLIGRIPTAEEVRDFEQDRRPTKRAELVHRLLYEKKFQPKVNGKPVVLERKGKETKVLEFDYTEEFADHWANVWTTWLLTRTAPVNFRTSMHDWLEGEFLANTPHNDFVNKLLTANGKTDDNGAAAFIIQHLGEKVSDDKSREDGVYDAIPITSRTTRLFLGLQTQCTQCHDHPFNPDWKQDNFWGVNAFFRQVSRNPPAMAAQNNQPAPSVELLDVKDVNRTATVFFEKRSGLLQDVRAKFLKDVNMDPEKAAKVSKDIPLGSKKSRRELLADFVVKHDNFAPAQVNRMWGHLFGRGLNEQPAVDDFGEHNKVVHPELLEQLSKHFADYKYDNKQLLEWICTSDPYNLSYVAVKKVNDTAEAEAFFTRVPLKSMSPEQLYDSLETALKGERDPNKAARATARQQWMAKLVRNFGDDEGNEGTFNGTVVQSLLMMNGKELHDELSRDGSSNSVNAAIARGMKSPNGKEAAIIDELFMIALGRHASRAPGATYPKPRRPETSELAVIQRGLDEAKVAAMSKPNPPKDMNELHQQYYQDVLWALLNTGEFILNH